MQGKELEGEAEGILGMKQAWPSTIRTVKGDHKRFEETYFSAFPVRLCLPAKHQQVFHVLSWQACQLASHRNALLTTSAI